MSFDMGDWMLLAISGGLLADSLTKKSGGILTFRGLESNN